jgi:ketosteroid isomerase-like protein
MNAQIPAEDVRAEVQRFWNILSGKSSDRLEQMYSPSALVFTGKAKRSELGRFVAVRRMRQVVGPDSAAGAELDTIEVQPAGPDVAIATYTYRFYSTRADKAGGREQRLTLSGRSTQVFQRDDRGALKIVHEHLSSAAPPKVEKDSSGKA